MEPPEVTAIGAIKGSQLTRFHRDGRWHCLDCPMVYDDLTELARHYFHMTAHSTETADFFRSVLRHPGAHRQ